MRWVARADLHLATLEIFDELHLGRIDRCARVLGESVWVAGDENGVIDSGSRLGDGQIKFPSVAFF